MSTEEAVKRLDADVSRLAAENARLARELAAVQSQVASLSQLLDQVGVGIGNITTAAAIQTDDDIAIRTALQLFAEVVMKASPEVKRLCAEEFGQVLARPDLATNPRFTELLQQLHVAATNPTRLTPDGRRAWLHLVPKGPKP
jgi:hypothetical protein